MPLQADLDGDGIVTADEMALVLKLDHEGDGVIDVFATNSSVDAPGIFVPGQPANPYDMNDSGCVDGGDVGIFITQWGANGGFADFNNDGQVNSADLGLLIAAWGCG